MESRKEYNEGFRKENTVENEEKDDLKERKEIIKTGNGDKKQPQLSLQILDAVLILAENLLAFRVVVSFLGGGGGDLIYKITNPLVAPFFFMQRVLTAKADNSVLEIIPVILVFALAIIHSHLDKKVFFA